MMGGCNPSGNCRKERDPVFHLGAQDQRTLALHSAGELWTGREGIFQMVEAVSSKPFSVSCEVLSSPFSKGRTALPLV